MTGPAMILRDIHRLRRRARDLREQLDRLPVQLKAHKARADRQEQARRDAQEALKKLKVTTLEKESRLKAQHQLIAKYEKQRDEAEARKEYEALQHEIAAARQVCQTLEDEILTAMMETEEKTAALPSLDKAVEEARLEYQKFEQSMRDRQEALQKELAEALAQLKETEGHLPDKVRSEYERAVNARGADALAAVRDGACSACSTALTAQKKNDLLLGEVVICNACGRILYLPTDPPS